MQRLLLSGILPEAQQQELREVVRALDPLGLFEQVKQLQEAFLQSVVDPFSSPLSTLVPAFLPFSLEQCFSGPLPQQAPETVVPLSLESHILPQERQIDFLNWPRTTRDPFEGEWEHILAEVLAHPERSSGELFQQLQQ